MLRILAVSTLLTLSIGACAATQEPPVATPLTAGKTTCDELVLPNDVLGLEIVDRVLVPYSREILGVEATYEDNLGRRLTAVSGGYLDDITETYDNLQPAGTTELADATADVLEGSFLGTPITVVYLIGSDPPCSTLAVVAIGFSPEEFAEIAPGMMLMEHGTVSSLAGPSQT